MILLAVLAMLQGALEPTHAWHAPLVLSDQFGQAATLPLPEQQPFVLVLSDREGSAQARHWLKLVGEGGCVLVEAAHLGAAPAVARPFIRRAFRDAPPVLLDWRGDLARQLGFEDQAVNVYLTSADGVVAGHWHGLPDPASAGQLRILMERHCVLAD